MAGLRERKRRKTVEAIHRAGLRLFAERGYSAVTVADIAEEAEVSRATVFAYFPSKELIVLGDAAAAVESLHASLADAELPVIEGVRAWLRTLAGWIEPDIVLQRRLAEEIPAIAAARSRIHRELEAVIRDALTREIGSPDPLPARLGAGALTSLLAAVESEAADRFANGAPPLDADAVDGLMEAAVAFVEAGLERVLQRDQEPPLRNVRAS